MMLITCLYILSQVIGTSAVGLAEGKEFLISTPSMKLPFNKGTGYPRLVLTLLSSFTDTVKLVTEGLRNTNNYLERKLIIRPFQSVKFYDKKHFFGPDLKSGIRWAYHLTGNDSFAVMVSMETDLFIVETFTAVPVSSWGSRYIITTLDINISVVLIAGESRNVLTFTFKQQPKHFTLLVNGLERNQGSEFKIELTRYQAYSIDNCVKNSVGSLTGSSVEGFLPFGVVSGNCNGYARTEKSYSTTDSAWMEEFTGSTVAEMLLPVESLGNHFIMFLMKRYHSRGYVIVVASENLTSVTYKEDKDNRTPKTHIDLMEKGDWHNQSAAFTSVNSTKPVYVTYVRYTCCLGISDGGPSILMLIPIELFYFIYKCMVPDTTMRNYVTLVTNVKFKDSVQVMYFEGEDPILGLTNRYYVDLSVDTSIGDFNVLDYEVKRGVNFILYSLTSRFGCYIHGLSPYATYMHPAGFISSNINPKFCMNSEKSMKKEDFLDNDCDGKVDEEIANGKDDDASFRKEPNPIDEDLGFYFEEGDTINAILSIVPDKMRQLSLSTFKTKDYYTSDYVYSTSAKTTEYNLEQSTTEVVVLDNTSPHVNVFSTSAKKTTATGYNLENYTTEVVPDNMSQHANVFSTSTKKTATTEYNLDNHKTEDNMSQHTHVFSTSAKKTATTEYILERHKTEGTSTLYYVLMAMTIVVITALAFYVFIVIQNNNSKLPIPSKSPSQKSIKSVEKESDVQFADQKANIAALSTLSIEHSV